MGVLHIVQQAVSPSLAPTGIGHHWVNTVTKDTWISVGTSSVADWKKVNNDAAIATHEAAADPHPQYTTDIESIVKALIFG